MPIHLPSATRRDFLAQVGGAVVCAPALHAAAAERVDADCLAILNDTHIAAWHPANANIPTHLRETVAWLLAQGPQVIPIPGTKRVHRLEENAAAAAVRLSAADLDELDALPAPTGDRY